LGGYAHLDGGHERLPRKSCALLAYLAMQEGRGAGREHLARLLWDASDPEKARHSLRQGLASLRRALVDAGADPIVALDRDLLAIKPGAVEVDVHRFAALAQSADVADLAAAAALYGGPFLAGFDADAEPFEAWARVERARLQGVAAEALRRLAAEQTGEPGRALDAAERLAALDPLNEGDRRLLMRLLAAAGRRVEALRQFESLREALRASLGVPPSEATRALARTLRSQDAGEAPPDGERRSRPLAALACEWLGAQAWPPERQNEAAALCLQRAGEWLAASGAHVARNASDGVIAYFGFAQSREQDVETAARAALDLRGLAARWSEEVGATMEMCAGLAYGQALVKEQPAAKGPDAVGSAVSLACRLRHLAAPGEILIDPDARQLVRGLFEYGEVRSLPVKGLADPVEAATLIGATSTQDRFEALRAARLSPLFGRDEEMDLLRRCWRQAIEGEGAVVLLVGEPGIGKSRLIRAFLEQRADAGVRVDGSPYGASSPLHPFTALITRATGVLEADTPDERRAKLAAAVAAARLPQRLVERLAPLVGVGDADRVAPDSPDAERGQTLAALAAWIEALARTREGAALVVVEDAHWVDPTTRELLEILAKSAPRRRLLLILAARPEFAQSWTARPGGSTIALAGLRARDAARIVAHASAHAPLPALAIEKIVAMAEGVPLFLEELSFALRGRRAPAAQDEPREALELPATLRAVLLARLDQLGGAREVAQVAAALGRSFSARRLAAAAGLPGDALERALEELVAANWVWRRGPAADGEYVFRHALLQDAAYHALADDARRALHARVARAIEAEGAKVSAAQPETLARHCEEAGEYDRAAPLWTKAGQLSLAQSALREAAAQFARALALFDPIPSDKALRAAQLAAQVGLANALMHTRGYAAPETRAVLATAQSLYARMEALGERPEDSSLLLAVLHGVWVASHVAFDGAAVRELSRALMAQVEKRPSPFAQAVAHRVMGASLLFLGDFNGARTHLDLAFALYEPAAHRALAARFGQDVGVAVLSNRPLAVWALGFPDDAAREAEAAVGTARSVGQVGTTLYMLARVAWIRLVAGDIAGADALLAELEATTADAEGSYWRAAASLLLGCREALAGDAAAGVRRIAVGVAAARARGAGLLRLPWYFGCLATAHLRLGEFNAAQDCLAEAFAAVTRTEEAWPEAELRRLAGEVALAGPAPDRRQAAEHFEAALRIARRQCAKSWELRAAVSLARLRRDAGGPRQARVILEPVYDRFSQGLSTPDLQGAARLIAELTDRPTPEIRRPVGAP